MAVVIATTDSNLMDLTMDWITAEDNQSFPLNVNTNSPFTLHYALWPFSVLILVIVTVWLIVYISTVLSRRHSAKSEHRNFASLYVTQDSTIAGGCEVSAVVSATNV